ncbi:MAG TPA: hemerythrin domain-containing protein [Chloroflexia bacterium]|nr:hemerythrin domain-containing protein [Chloroflexia bacterium]
MDAIELLKKDHDKVKKLFQQIMEGATPTKSKTLFNQIYHEMTIHSIIEEQVFYPALNKFNGFTGLLKDAYKEHADAKLEMGQISMMDSSSEEWKKKVEKLFGEIQHHIKDEEEKLFPKVEEAMAQKELNDLGLALKQAKTSNLSDSLLSQPLPESLTQQPAQ